MRECREDEIRDRLPDYVHGTLGAAERADVEAHVAACPSCRDEVALLRATRGAIVRRTPAVDVARVVSAVRASRGLPKTRPELARVRRVPQYAWRAAAAVAVVATGALGYWLGTVNRAPKAGPGTVAVSPTIQLQNPIPTPPTISPAVPATAPAPQQVAVAAAPQGLSFGGGVADLPADQVSSLMNELDRIAPAIDIEPEADIDLGTGR